MKKKDFKPRFYIVLFKILPITAFVLMSSTALFDRLFLNAVFISGTEYYNHSRPTQVSLALASQKLVESRSIGRRSPATLPRTHIKTQTTV